MKKITFKNLPDKTTPISANNLNQLQNNVDEAILNPVVESIECKNIAPNLMIGDITNFATGSIPVFSASTTRMTFQQIFIDISNHTNLIASINSSFKLCVILCDSANKVTRSTDYVASYSFTRANTEKYLYIKVKKDDNSEITSDDLSSVQLQIEKGSTATSYTPFKKYGYNSQESMGSIVVDDIRSKNLLDENGVIVEGSVGFPVYVEAGKTYTISSNLPIYWFKISDNRDSSGKGAEWLAADGYTEYTFTCTKSYPYVFIGINKDNPYNLPTNLEGYANYEFQIEDGPTATNHSKYKRIVNVETGWHDIAFKNTYSNYDTSLYDAFQYRKINNQVFLRGMIKNTSVPTYVDQAIAGTLPEGVRPKNNIYFLGDEVHKPVECSITPSGDIRLFNTAVDKWVSITGINFFVD